MAKTKKTSLGQGGFSYVELLLVAAVLLFVAAVGYFVYHRNNSATAHASSWLLLASSTNKETTESVYVCLDKVSSKLWTVRGDGELTPPVTDAGKYTVGISLGNDQHGGGDSSSTWTADSSASVKGSFDPQGQVYSVSSYMQAPKNDPFTKGGGGGPLLVSSLPPC